jgi:hypothetical protein
MRPLVPAALLAIVLVVMAAACSSGGDGPALTGLSTGMPCSLRWSEAEEVGALPGERREVSGFVASAERKSIAWMVRDSGNPAALYSFEVDDSGKITSRELPVEGATNGDWEDVAYTSVDGDGHLWILDGDERLLLTSSTRTDSVYVAEPAQGWTGTPPVFELQMPAAQREAGDFFPYHGCDIVLLDEREHIWLLRNQR